MTTAAPFYRNRIGSIDLLRGIVMVIMAIDHTRDFLHNDSVLHDPLDLSTTTPFLYFTRWITHFCVPTFVLLAGVSAYLVGSTQLSSQWPHPVSVFGDNICVGVPGTTNAPNQLQVLLLHLRPVAGRNSCLTCNSSCMPCCASSISPGWPITSATSR